MRRALALLLAVLAGLPAASMAENADDPALVAFNAGDFPTAREAFAPRAAAGDASAQFYIGIMRLKGLDGPADRAAARAWLLRAAEQEHAAAQHRLAELYGTEDSPVEALRWLRRSAENGWFAAQMALARRYAAGDGVPIDPVEALKWYDIAAEMGLDPYNADRDALAATMDSSMIAETARRTRGWLAAHRRWDDEAIAATAATGRD
jgi:TPR repeat protein